MINTTFGIYITKFHLIPREFNHVGNFKVVGLKHVKDINIIVGSFKLRTEVEFIDDVCYIKLFADNPFPIGFVNRNMTIEVHHDKCEIPFLFASFLNRPDRSFCESENYTVLYGNNVLWIYTTPEKGGAKMIKKYLFKEDIYGNTIMGSLKNFIHDQ